MATNKKAVIKKKQERQRELSFTFGEQDPLDILSYAGLEENADYLCIDGVYIRTLFVSGYPFVASSGWLDSLINFNHGVKKVGSLNLIAEVVTLGQNHRTQRDTDGFFGRPAFHTDQLHAGTPGINN